MYFKYYVQIIFILAKLKDIKKYKKIILIGGLEGHHCGGQVFMGRAKFVGHDQEDHCGHPYNSHILLILH